MPTRAEIAPLVIEKIAAVAHVSSSDVNEKDRLEADLGMTTTVRRAMALPFNGIVSDYAPDGERITMDEAGDLKTVAASIALVTKRANRQ